MDMTYWPGGISSSNRPPDARAVCVSAPAKVIVDPSIGVFVRRSVTRPATTIDGGGGEVGGPVAGPSHAASASRHDATIATPTDFIVYFGDGGRLEK